jgi:hypothetical protein
MPTFEGTCVFKWCWTCPTLLVWRKIIFLCLSCLTSLYVTFFEERHRVLLDLVFSLEPKLHKRAQKDARHTISMTIEEGGAREYIKR